MIASTRHPTVPIAANHQCRMRARGVALRGGCARLALVMRGVGRCVRRVNEVEGVEELTAGEEEVVGRVGPVDEEVVIVVEVEVDEEVEEEDEEEGGGSEVGLFNRSSIPSNSISSFFTISSMSSSAGSGYDRSRIR